MRRYLVFLVMLFLVLNISAQESVNNQLDSRGEVYISILQKEAIKNQEKLSLLSFDKNTNDRVFFYANRKAFSSIIDNSINYKLESIPSLLTQVKMLDNAKQFSGVWNAYPTYDQYDSIMHKFASDYPNMCKFHNLGTLASGRKILALQLGDSVNVNQNEPSFLYTSTMHGDETVGYVISLRLIEYLLENYNTNNQVKYIMDNVDIWINPLGNPDGTYHTGNSSVNGATRYNINNVDLNRNYPDPEDGPHPDGNTYQAETQIFMDLADSINFTMSANMHSGAEVVNYPWDTWSQLPADNNWWVYVSKMFADTAQANSPSGYMTKFGTGYTNGYQWYSIWGGRQDYMNYFKHCREFVVELSNVKLLAESQLQAHWNYLHPSLLNYMEEVTYGIKGKVTDSITGFAVKAKVEILNHDFDSSSVYSNDSGFYYRPIFTGIYDIKYSAIGYKSKVFELITVANSIYSVIDIELAPETQSLNSIELNNKIEIFPNPAKDILSISSEIKMGSVEIYNTIGALLYSQIISDQYKVNLDVSSYKSGVYIVKIDLKAGIIYKKIIIQ